VTANLFDSSMQVYAKINKQNNILFFHRVCEAIASGMVGFYFIPSDINPADIISKHWANFKYGNNSKRYYSGKVTLVIFKIKNEMHQEMGSVKFCENLVSCLFSVFLEFAQLSV
jgi:hypothetical protein